MSLLKKPYWRNNYKDLSDVDKIEYLKKSIRHTDLNVIFLSISVLGLLLLYYWS